MKCAFLIPGIDAMGQNIFVQNLVQGLMQSPHLDCVIFHFNRGKTGVPTINFYVPVHRLNFWSKYDFNDFDIIFSGMPVPDLYIAIHGLYKTNTCITFMHCFMKPDLLQRKQRLIGIIEYQIWRYALSKFDNIIVSSGAMQTYYEKVLRKGINYKILPYGIPEIKIGTPSYNIVQEIEKFKDGRYALCGCGTLIRRKGFHHLVNYLSHNEESVVILIGEGIDKDELEQLGERLNVRNRLLFLGWLPNPYNYYPYMDVFCMSSNSEGFGLALLEAMCVGTPIVCSNLDIYKDYFDDGNVGQFEFGDQNSFNDAVDRVIENRDYYAKQSRRLYEEKFSLHQMCSCHYEYYKSILKH